MPMTTLNASRSTDAELLRQGYSIADLIGFKDHWIPLYTHKDVSDKKVGDVAFSMRVGDPARMNASEQQYVHFKAAQGFFLFKPGADCMSRKRPEITRIKRPLGGDLFVTSEEMVFGCRWCRERSEPELSSPTPVLAEPSPDEVPPLANPTAAAPAIPDFDVLHCPKCPQVFVGENAMNDRRGHQMREHKNKPGTTRGKRVPAEGSAKES